MKKTLVLFIIQVHVLVCLFSCTQKSEINTKSETNSVQETNKLSDIETENNVSELNKRDLIKAINRRLKEAFKKETIIRLVDDSYIHILKDGNDVEFIYELGYDSEGWPMEGEIFYFHEGEVIGYAYMHCDGCIGIEIYENINKLKFSDYNSKNDDIGSIDCIHVLNLNNNEIEKKAKELVDKCLNKKELTITKLLNNVFTNNENGFETFLTFEENYSDKTGVMTLSQKGCKYVYNITLKNEILEADFFQSTCGAKSSDTKLYYNESDNSLSMYINGQEFIFYSEF